MEMGNGECTEEVQTQVIRGNNNAVFEFSSENGRSCNYR